MDHIQVAACRIMMKMINYSSGGPKDTAGDQRSDTVITMEYVDWRLLSFRRRIGLVNNRRPYAKRNRPELIDDWLQSHESSGLQIECLRTNMLVSNLKALLSGLTAIIFLVVLVNAITAITKNKTRTGQFTAAIKTLCTDPQAGDSVDQR